MIPIFFIASKYFLCDFRSISEIINSTVLLFIIPFSSSVRYSISSLYYERIILEGFIVLSSIYFITKFNFFSLDLYDVKETIIFFCLSIEFILYPYKELIRSSLICEYLSLLTLYKLVFIF